LNGDRLQAVTVQKASLPIDVKTLGAEETVRKPRQSEKTPSPTKPQTTELRLSRGIHSSQMPIAQSMTVCNWAKLTEEMPSQSLKQYLKCFEKRIARLKFDSAHTL
jgi:hypothetical protein